METGPLLDQFETKKNEFTDFYYTETGELREKQNIPGDTGIKTKAWIGIIFCLLGGLIGLLLLRQCFIQAKDALETYRKNPDLYKRSSYLLVKQGENLAYLGLWIFLGGIGLLIVIISVRA